MSLFAIPQPGPIDDLSGSFRNRGSISAGAQEAQMWDSVGQIGRQITHNAQRKIDQRQWEAKEWRDRQDAFTRKMASVDLQQSREAFKSEQERRTDLLQLGKNGKVGWDQAEDDYATYLEDSTTKASEQIPEQWRGMWLQAEQQQNEDELALFHNSMIDRRTVYNVEQARDQIISVALGNPEKGIAPDPEGAMRLASESVAIVPEKHQAAFLDDALEQVAYGIINTNPPQAIGFLNKAKERYEQKTWNRLMNAAKAAKKQQKDDIEFATKEQVNGTLVRLVSLIDQRHPNTLNEIRSAPELEGITDDTDDARKEGTIGRTRLMEWNTNRDRKVVTDFGKSADLMGDVIDSLGKPDQSGVALKLADARYGAKGYLDQGSYDELRGLLGKKYPAHGVASVKAAYDAIKRNPGRLIMVPGIMGGAVARVPISGEDRINQMGQFLGWFDGQMTKGTVPDVEQSLVAARKLGISGGQPPLVAVASRSTGLPEGMVERGNIDLLNRPDVANQDGTHSSVRSISVGIDSKEVLIPTVSEDGRIMSNDEAVAQYRKTGRHLGKFSTVETANHYAEQIHEDQERLGKLLSGLSDEDAAAVRKLLKSMTIDEFEKKYGTGK